MSERKSFPLSWPDGWKRTKSRKNGKFVGRDKNWITIRAATERVLYELGRLGVTADDIIISTNVPTRLDGMPRSDMAKPSDPGAAVYWQSKKHGMRCIATDQYTEVADNLAGIAATLEAMRAIERHGGAEILDRAFKGFAALPERATSHWKETLGIQGQPTRDLIESRFRALVKIHHPDTGGDRDEFEKIAQAREAALLEIA